MISVEFRPRNICIWHLSRLLQKNYNKSWKLNQLLLASCTLARVCVCVFFVSYFSVETRLIWLSSTDSFINVLETSKMKMNKTIPNRSKFFFSPRIFIFSFHSFSLSASLDVCTYILKLVGRSFYRVRMKSFIVSSLTSVIWCLYIFRFTICYS